nr:MAG TPA: hypothetical protein [Caudoviricetes sp.]
MPLHCCFLVNKYCISNNQLIILVLNHILRNSNPIYSHYIVGARCVIRHYNAFGRCYRTCANTNLSATYISTSRKRNKYHRRFCKCTIKLNSMIFF